MRKRLFCLFIMWCSIINAYAQEDTTSVEKPAKCYSGTSCSITRLGLWGFDVHKDDRLILSADFDNGQMLRLSYNSEPNDLSIPSGIETENPGHKYKWKCECLYFYPSGNLRRSGILLHDKNFIDYTSFDYGEWKKYEDHGVTVQQSHHIAGVKIYETLLDGKLNGTQVIMNSSLLLLYRINYYKSGILCAQFMFDGKNRLKGIAYDIAPNDLSEEYEYKCTYIEYGVDGTKLSSSVKQFNAPSKYGGLQLH